MNMKLPKGSKKAIKRYLKSRFRKEQAKAIMQKTSSIYTDFVREAPAPLVMNFLRSKYYGGLSIFAFYEAMERDVDNDVLQEILWCMLLNGGDIRRKRPIRLRFSETCLQRITYSVLKKYSAFVDKKADSGKWKNVWRIKVNPDDHRNGFCMPLTNCPVAAFAKRHRYEHLMPLFCGSDFKVAEKHGMRLIRTHTEAEGAKDCDFWYLFGNEKAE